MDIQIQKAFRKSKRVTLETGKGLTEQSHARECDINYILKDYVKTGLIKHAKENQGRYDDVTSADFQNAMFIVAQGKNMFEELPAQIRKSFSNDVSAFLEFAQNPNNGQALEKMGILKGNDGFDMSGAPTLAPTETTVKAAKAEAENTAEPAVK